MRAAAVLLALLLAPPAFAHERSASFSTWTVEEGGADVDLTMDGRDLTRPREAADGQRAADLAVAAAFVAGRGGVPCVAAGPPSHAPQAGGRVRLRWRVDCPNPGSFAIGSSLPQVLAVPHLAFVKVRIPGAGEFETVLHADQPRWEQSSPPPAAADFFRLGLRHIAGGADHLVFLFGLVVAALSLGEVAVVVTAFTAAHALTLAAAALGLLRPLAPSVESLIAVSIGLLAVENLTLPGGAGAMAPPVAALVVLGPALAAAAAGAGRVALGPLTGTALFAACYLALSSRHPAERRLRWLVAFAFGLLHGLGFAGALVESGFAGGSVAAALLAFHAGVEVGQLLFVAGLWLLLGRARRRGGFTYRRSILEPGSVAMLAAAVCWYGLRAFG